MEIDWRVLYPHLLPPTKPGYICGGWEIHELNLKTGTVTRLHRDRDGLFRLSEEATIHYLFDIYAFGEVIDIINPWDYVLNMDGMEAFIYDHLFVPETVPLEGIHGHPMEEEYRAKRKA